jgi:hypothetical protein
VAILDADEQRFLEASMAYAAGNPIMADADYDQLKTELKQRGSIVSAQVGCVLCRKSCVCNASV